MHYGAHAAATPYSALYQLMMAIAKRIADDPLPSSCVRARFPVGLLMIRGDRAGEGKLIAEQVLASFDFWDADSADALDIILAGWSAGHSGPTFRLEDFLDFKRVLEKSSKWRYSGETDLLLLNFELDVQSLGGRFDYSEVIVLRIEEMLRAKHIGSIDGLVSSLTTAAKKVPASAHILGNSVIWQISDATAVHTAKKAIWQSIKRLLPLANQGPVEALEHFAVKNLSIKQSPNLKVTPAQSLSLRNVLALGKSG